jgi:recombinational DNA repair ATPase RecF
MDYVNRTLLTKENFESINGDYYKKFTSYEIDLIKERDSLLSYLSAILTALTFMEKSFGKVNDKVIEFRKYYNKVNSNFNDINEILANNKELSDKIYSAF